MGKKWANCFGFCPLYLYLCGTLLVKVGRGVGKFPRFRPLYCIIGVIMATIYLTLSAKADKATGLHRVLVRFKHGKIDQRAKTAIFVLSEYWDSEAQSLTIPRFRLMSNEQRELCERLSEDNSKLQKIKEVITQSFIEAGAGKLAVSADWLTSTIDQYSYPEKYAKQTEDIGFFELFEYYINNRKFSDWRKRAFWVVYRTLKRFSLYSKQELDINTFSVDVLRQYEQYLRDEYLLYDQLQMVFEQVPDSRKPEPRGQNTINGILTKMRTFFLWAIENEYTTNNPFRRYQVEECVYGTPYYITIEERNHLYNADLSKYPQLAIQRDIFVFQCLIGCRVSDLYALTKDNIIDGAVEYIPRKTKEGRPITVRVPLSTIAKEILDRYKDCKESLFPFISQQKYNIAIKRMFVEAGITRTVTVINPTTREEEQRPICEIASSHLARRAFVGNLYKQVKDPNLIGKLSGHKEGSKAFVRYRDIDEDMRKELVALLE